MFYYLSVSDKISGNIIPLFNILLVQHKLHADIEFGPTKINNNCYVLFVSVQAGNVREVAGKASKTFLNRKMDPRAGLTLDTASAAAQVGLESGSADLEGLLSAGALDMMEGDFLDSFLDLSNFLDMPVGTVLS